jgi:hypothetical protein
MRQTKLMPFCNRAKFSDCRTTNLAYRSICWQKEGEFSCPRFVPLASRQWRELIAMSPAVLSVFRVLTGCGVAPRKSG